MPPAAQEKLRRVARQQKQLLDKARRLSHTFDKYRCPKGKLPQTIEIMEQLQVELEKGGYVHTAAKKRQVVLSNLAELKTITKKQKKLRRDRSALLPEELRKEISASLGEDVPREYRDMVENYFKSVSEAGNR
jgi:hypothetical protein